MTSLRNSDNLEIKVHLIARTAAVSQDLVAALSEREVSLWLRGSALPRSPEALAGMLRLPWKQVFLEESDHKLLAELEMPDASSMVRRRGFIHVIDSDPSRISLPTRALPVFLLSGRDTRGSDFENQLRRMTMLEELRRSAVRQLVVIGNGITALPDALRDIWSTGFRTRLLVVDDRPEAPAEVASWLDHNGHGPTATVATLAAETFALEVGELFGRTYQEQRILIRQRNESGALRQIDLTDADDPERPLLGNYDLILEKDLAYIGNDELPEDAFNAFFRGEADDWRAFAAGLPWIRTDEPARQLLSQMTRLDAAGASENRIAYIQSEPGAGGTTLARHLAFTAARAGYPTLVAKGVPFTPDALPVANFLTRARHLSEEQKASDVAFGASVHDSRLYETPWVLVFDRVHWEFRDTELRHFLQQLVGAGRPACIVVVTGPQRGMAFFDESRFKRLAELHHMLDQAETLALGNHLNRYLRHYGKERPEWQWLNFQESHSVRYLDGLAAFWITLSFWLQTHFDLNESIQSWVYRVFSKYADTAEIRKAIAQIAALSSERLPMPESLIEQGASEWPVSLMLDDRRGDLSALGLVRLSHDGRKFWAMAHDILGRLLINAIFFDPAARASLGFKDAKDAQQLRFQILREVSRKPALAEAAERDYGEEFATTVFKVDPDHGRGSWVHIWRDVLSALDEMPAALRNGSRVFRHHTAISRRRIAWLDENAYGISSADREQLLVRAADDIVYALHSIDGRVGDEPDINLYNSLANTYLDLARVRAEQGAKKEELAELRQLASDATRHAYDQNPSSPYVIETHVKGLIASAEESRSEGAPFCIEALEILYGAIRHDSNELRRHSLAKLADRALRVLMSSKAAANSVGEPKTPTEVLVRAWHALTTPLGDCAPDSLDQVPADVLASVLRELDHPAGASNAQVLRLRYQVLVALAPTAFEPQIEALDLLVATDYRLTPQLRLEYALLLFQQMRTEEANREFKSLRRLWRESEVFVQVPSHLRWLLQHGTDQRRVVSAVPSHDHGQRAMAKVREFARFDVPYRPQEFGVREHTQGAQFSAVVSFGHNGPFLRPVNSPRH